MNPALVPGEVTPTQPRPALVATDEKSPAAGTTVLPVELHDLAEAREEIPYLYDANGELLTSQPVQITPASTPTPEKVPGEGTSALPPTLHDRSEDRMGIPAPRDPFKPTPPVPTVTVLETSITTASNAPQFIHANVLADPAYSLGVLSLRRQGSSGGTNFNVTVTGGGQYALTARFIGSAGTYTYRVALNTSAGTVLSNPITVTIV